MCGGPSITTPTNYQPPGQAQAGSQYQDIVNNLYGQITAGTTPGQQLGPYAQTAGVNAATNPYAGVAQTGALNAVSPGANIQAIGQTGANELTSGAGQILSTGFDPQQALFSQNQNQVMQQVAAANAAAGIQGSPYGASVAGNTLGNFDINWANNQLQREATALGQAGTGYGSAVSTGTQGINTGVTSSAQPYSTYNTTQSNTINDIAAAIQAANLQYTLPQQTLSDLMSYLNLGQSASSKQSQIDAQNLQNTMGVFQGLGNLFGSAVGTGLDLFAA